MNGEIPVFSLSRYAGVLVDDGGEDKPKTSQRKKRITDINIEAHLLRLMQMFKWRNLPDTITQRFLESVLLTRGHIGFINVDDKYYVSWGSLGGIPNAEYMPSDYIISNPFLNLKSYVFKRFGDDANVVVIPNNSAYSSVLDLISLRAEFLTEISLTKLCILINYRNPDLLVAATDNQKKDIDDYIQDLLDGRIKSVADKNLLKDSKILSSQSGVRGLMTQILEAEQYEKAAMFNDFGLQMNYNMKRESITSSEAQLGEGALLPYSDDMMDMRKQACKDINNMFGLNLDVDFGSAWKNLRMSIQLEIKSEEKESDNVDKGDENGENKNSEETE